MRSTSRIFRALAPLCGTLFTFACVVACSGDPPAAEIPPPPPSEQTTGSWRNGKAVAEARTEVVAVAARGKIYLFGGLSQGGGSDRVDIYDPKSDSWSTGPNLPAQAPRHHMAAAVHGDRIYILGGYREASFSPTAATWELDAMWRQRADQPLARGAATAQTLGDRIYVTGGANGGTIYAEVYAYDPVADSWAPRRAMPTPREHLASCAVSGKLLVAGGRTGAGNLDTAELYDPAPDSWTTLPSLPTARGGLGGAALGDVCHIVGGEFLDRAPPNTFSHNEGYDAKSGAWKLFAPMPTARHGLGVAALDGALYVMAGGETAGFSYSTRVEIFTP
jgi:N-acetylneuraminic acid mutarotase